MGVVKSAIGDMLMTFSWVVLSATFVLQTTVITSAAGFQGIDWAPLAITTFLIFVYVSIFTVVFGSASFNPTGSAAFYAAGIPGDTLFTLAIRLPAQKWEELYSREGIQKLQGSSSINPTNSPLEAEAMALSMAVQQMKNLSYDQVTFISDCKRLIDGLHHQ
ncbi:unnamed protein product [Brassica oleracea]